MWGLINVLQFVIFMQKWQIPVPYDTLIWLQTLKAIALFEFFPKKWFTDYVQIKLGLKIKAEIQEEGDEDSHTIE